MEEIPVLDYGFIRLDGIMVDVTALFKLAEGEITIDDVLDTDLSVVNSARVSFGLRKMMIDKADEGLIGYLMGHQHGTPFEHNGFRFHVKAPIKVFREWQRHRIASYNELSTRYKELTNPDFYIPRVEDLRSQVGKPGAYSFEPFKGNSKQVRATMERHFLDSFDLYRWYVDAGLAKEQASGVLPLYMYSEMYWTCNARALMNFCNLRNSEQAMWEIRQYAQVVEAIWALHMPRSHKAFIENGRVAP
jgi:thymidylate synthase (FAD)